MENILNDITNIEMYERQKQNLMNEINHLNEIRNQLEKAKEKMPIDEYNKELSDIQRHMDSVVSRVNNIENLIQSVTVNYSKDNFSSIDKCIEFRKNSIKEIEYLNSQMDALEASKNNIPLKEYESEKDKIQKYINKEQQKIKRLEEILKACQTIVTNINALNRLNKYTATDEYSINQRDEEIRRRTEEINSLKYKIPLEILKEIKEKFEKYKANSNQKENDIKTTPDVASSNTKIQSQIPALPAGQEILALPPGRENNLAKDEEKSQAIPLGDGHLHKDAIPLPGTVEPIPLPPSKENSFDEEKSQAIPLGDGTKQVPAIDSNKDNNKEENKKPEPLKVVSSRKWNLTDKQKKILIGVGVAAIIAATIVATQALIPAITAAMQASEVSSIAASMIKNAAEWHLVGTAEQISLHGANIKSAISLFNLTGSGAVFNGAAGTWTIGGLGLEAFASQAASVAAAASAKVAALSATAAGLGLGGIAALSTGLNKNKNGHLMPDNASKKIYDACCEDFEKISQDFEVSKDGNKTLKHLDDFKTIVQSNDYLNKYHKTKLIVNVEKLRKKVNKMLKEQLKHDNIQENIAETVQEMLGDENIVRKGQGR